MASDAFRILQWALHHGAMCASALFTKSIYVTPGPYIYIYCYINMNIFWILAVITILGLILTPFLIVHSSIHNYFIALEDGELLTPDKFFACVNSFCYYFKN